MHLLDFEGHVHKANNCFGDKKREEYDEACTDDYFLCPNVDCAEEAQPGSL